MGLLQSVVLLNEVRRLKVLADQNPDNLVAVEGVFLQAVDAELEEYRVSLMSNKVPDAIHFTPSQHVPDGLVIVTDETGNVLFFGRSGVVLEHEFPVGSKIHLSPRQHDLMQQKLAATQKGVAVEGD